MRIFLLSAAAIASFGRFSAAGIVHFAGQKPPTIANGACRTGDPAKDFELRLRLWERAGEHLFSSRARTVH
jgi:hypothetical protein